MWFFQRVADPVKIERIRAEIRARRPSDDIQAHLKSVRRVIIEGPQDAKFASLWQAVTASPAFKRDYAEAFFKYTDGLSRPHIISGTEACEELYRDITSKHSHLLVLSHLMQGLEAAMLKQYALSRRLDPDGAARVNLGLLWPQFQLYIEALLHTMKSTLELYAIFTGFLYPPGQRMLPAQMDDQIKFFQTDEGRKLDSEYARYLSEKMGWFPELKNLRDAVAHFGSAMVGAEESLDGKLHLSLYPRRTHLLENRIPYSQVQGWILLFLQFCEFYSAHFQARLRESH